jgi:predicted PurR-regulated permease PerM
MKKTPPILPRGAGNDWASRDHVHALVLIAATAIGLYLCYQLAKPFLASIAWAMALGVIFVPLQRRFETKLRRPSLAALLTVLVIIVIVFLPLALLTERLVSEAADGTIAVKLKIESGEWERAFNDHPRLAPIGRWISEHTNLPNAIGAVASWLAARGASLVRGSVVQIVGIALTFYLLFFFLRDRRAVLTVLSEITPLSTQSLNSLWKRIADTIHATIFGTLAVAAVQGVLGGLMFWFVGLPSPLLWGVVMTLLSIVPMLGPFLVWIPAAIYLASIGSWGKAILLTVWGAIVVGGIDNILRPILVGNRLKMHTVVTFVAVVGGLTLFGAAGLVWGPIVVTTTMWLLESWRARNATTPAP